LHKVNVKEARKNFRALLQLVEAGEEVILLRWGKEVARLVPPKTEEQTLPSLKEFRSSLNVKGEPLSQKVIQLREEERY